MFEGVRRQEIKGVFSKLSIVSFNYDRCIEFFLLHALQDLFGISNQEAAEAMSGLDIIRPYGVLAPLPELDPQHGIPFGAEHNRHRLAKMQAAIRTFTEAVEAEIVTTAQAKILEAETIVALGFSYHSQNMEILTPNARGPRPKRIFGTVYGMSKSDAELVRGNLTVWQPLHRGDDRIVLEDVKCGELLRNYKRSIAK